MRTLLVALLFIPVVSAHGAPAVLDVETQVIADDANDLSYATDGYDITNAYIRDAYWQGEHGIIARILASGATGNAGAAHLDLLIGGTKVFRLTTTDDVEWTTEATLVEAIAEADGELPASNANLQVFLTYDELGISMGDELSGFVVESYADGTLADSSEGGIYVVGTEVPSMTANPSLAAYETAAPDGYTKTNVTAEGLEVESLITTAGQHISVILGEAPGWSVRLDGQATASVNAAGTLKLPLIVDSMGTGSLPVMVETDLGGLETGYLVNNGTVAWSDTPIETAAAEPDGQASPGPALPLLAIGLLALVRTRARRQ